MRNLLSSETGQILLRLTVATLVGSVLGINRELRGKPAGMRTHALVTLGAALMGMMCAPPHLTTDIQALSRVIQGVLTGIGFLGGGVILRDIANQHVHGLTTAATIWIAASLGVACGIGYWVPVGTATGLVLLVLTFGQRIENLANKLFHHDDNPRSQSSS
ncbi:MAG: MgtC/SapB family protein [Acidobacteriota bacterium]